MNIYKSLKLTIALVTISPFGLSAADPWQDTSLSPAQRADDLISRLTLEEKASLMTHGSPAIPRLNIPEYNWWNEALHGVGRAGTATVLPQSIGMAATFDDDAVKTAFDMVSDEARAKYNEMRMKGERGQYYGLTFWTPNVNIFRDPRWGRGQETYGEDPCLASRMGVAVVKGLQGPSDTKYIKTIAGAKHYAVHSGPEWNRHSFNVADLDQRDLWETYLPAFKALVDAGVGQVMCAYQRFEGEPCCSSKKLLTQILRGEWGYDKIIVTDCWALNDFYREGAHETHAGPAETSADAVISGTDLECGPVLYSLKDAVDRGLITEKEIDSHLKRVLEARFALGEIDDDPSSPWSAISPGIIDCQAHKEIALDMARKSMTLLKNNGILPLPKESKGLLVMGPNAVDSVMQWGNYNGFPSHTVTILDGIKEKVGDVAYLRGCDHVVNSNKVSYFNRLSVDGVQCVSANYWNSVEPEGTPAARVVETTPFNFSTGGATVFAPGVNLADFSGLYRATFIPEESGDYVVAFSSDGGGARYLSVNGEKVIDIAKGNPYRDFAHTIKAEKGKAYDIELFYSHVGDGLAELKFDITRNEAYNTNPGDADVVIFVGGISPELEGEEMPVSYEGFRGGDRETIELPRIQRELMKQLKQQGKKIVYVNCSGSAVGITPEDSICDAVLQAWYPGQAGGTAVADVLFGDYNPAGRLPVTFYRDDSQLPDFEDYSMIGRTYRYMTEKPLYPFGYGLSYTTFDYKGAKLGKKKIKAGESVDLTVDVKNSGDRDGDEVVQIYMRPLDRKDGPSKTLCDFKRVNIKKGDTAKVKFSLSPAAFETFDHESGRMKVLPGRYELLYGPSSTDLTPVEVVVK